MVTGLQVNLKALTLSRKRVPIDRRYAYRITRKYLSGVPLEYIALQYQITLDEAKRIVEEGKKTTHFAKMQMTQREMYVESFQFFMNLGVPLYIIARLYNTTVDAVIDFQRENESTIRYYMYRSRILYKKNMRYHYTETPEGAAVLEKVKKMIKWKQR